MGKKAAPKKQAEPEKGEEPPAEEPEPVKEEAPAAEARQEAPAAAVEARELTLEEAKELAQYDLTGKITPYLDRHMLFKILAFHEMSGVYKKEDLGKAMIKLLDSTDLVDSLIDKYESLDMPVPDDLDERREQVLERATQSRDRVIDFLQIFEDDEKVKKIPSLTIEEMCSDFGVDINRVDDLCKHAKLIFDLGDYATSAELLKHLKSMFQASKPPMYVRTLWGSLACKLLDPTPEEEIESQAQAHPTQSAKSVLIFQLDEHLAESPAPKREILMHRTWLLHWTLFAIFKSERVDPKLVDFFLNEKSLSIISLSCPHLFRYVGACLILQKRLKNLVRDTIWIIHHESGSYSDPVTRFLLALYTEMDFDDAQHELQKCELVCKGDPFLADHWAEFQENARLHIFESYCRIHQCININMIASKLNMQAEEAELWIVKLIQNAKLDARIDSEKNRVVMTKAPPNVYQQVIEKTKNLAFRSTMLVSNLEKS